MRFTILFFFFFYFESVLMAAATLRLVIANKAFSSYIWLRVQRATRQSNGGRTCQWVLSAKKALLF